MSTQTDRAARIYVSAQLWAGVVGVLLVLTVLAVWITQAIGSAARVDHVVVNTPPAATCWDYAFGAPFPPGWSEGDAPLPSCRH